MRALGFCVSVDHARFMARVFQDAGIAATAIWADTPADERRAALADLAAGRVNVVFSVDLFNEGVDVPAVDTLLLLRPTDSPTLFLQQLGRGLRKRTRARPPAPSSTSSATTAKSSASTAASAPSSAAPGREHRAQVEHGFPFLPAGCHMELDPVARDIVLAASARPSPRLARALSNKNCARSGRGAASQLSSRRPVSTRGRVHGEPQLVRAAPGCGLPAAPADR